MRSRLTILALLAYGLAATFTVVGLAILAGGDANVGTIRIIRHSVPIDGHVGGHDRHVFGALLMAAGYVLWRWLFRQPGATHRVSVELQIVVVFAVLGYVAYRIGG